MPRPSSSTDQNMMFCSLNEACKRLGISRSTGYRLMAARKLCGGKVGSTWRFTPQEIQDARVLMTPPQKAG